MLIPIGWKREKKWYQAAESPDGFRSEHSWQEEIYVPSFLDIEISVYLENLEGWAFAWFLPDVGVNSGKWFCVSKEIPQELIPEAPNLELEIEGFKVFCAFIPLELVQEVVNQELAVKQNQSIFEKRNNLVKKAESRKAWKQHEKYYSKLVKAVGVDPLKEDFSPEWWWDNAPSGAEAWLEQQALSLGIDMEALKD